MEYGLTALAFFMQNFKLNVEHTMVYTGCFRANCNLTQIIIYYKGTRCYFEGIKNVENNKSQSNCLISELSNNIHCKI